jgi:hypothetical protein
MVSANYCWTNVDRKALFSRHPITLHPNKLFYALKQLYLEMDVTLAVN